jgi:hypothetical protein
MALTLLQFNDNDLILDLLQEARSGNFKNDAVLKFSIGEKAVTGKIEDASNATPIVITSTGAGALLSNGDKVVCVGVLGNQAANVTGTVANKATDSFELAAVAGNGAYIDPENTAYRGDWYRVVPDADDVSLTYDSGSNGFYVGSVPSTINLEENGQFVVVIRASNYGIEFVVDATAIRRRR